MGNSQTILIVDGDANSRNSLERILRLQGFDPLGLSSGKDAIDLVTKKAPPLALINLQLADIPGMDVLKTIKKISPNTECIILTGLASSETAIQSVNLGAYSYVQKPYDEDQLILRIKRALEKRETDRTLAETQARYSQLFNCAQDGIVTVNFDGKILDFNTSFKELVGYSGKELFEMTFWDLTPKKWYGLEETIIKEQVKARGYSDLYEKEYIHKNGTIIPIEVSAYLSDKNSREINTMWAYVRNISDRKLAETKLLNQLLEVTILQNITEAGTTADSVDDLIHQASVILQETLYPENFGIFLFDPNKGALFRHPSFKTTLNNDIYKDKAVYPSKGVLGRAYQTRLPQRVSDVSQDEDYLEAFSEIQSELAVPIIINDQVFGIINTESPTINHYSEEDEKILITLANQLATSITKIQLDTSQKQKTKEIAALYDTAVATSSIVDPESLYLKIYEQVHELFPLDTLILVEYNMDDETIKVAFAMEDGKPISDWLGKRFDKSESGLIGWVIQQRKPFLSHNLNEEILPVDSPTVDKEVRSWLGVPLITKGKVVGGLSVQTFDANVYDNNHQRLLESLAAQLASAIDNAQLIEQSKRQIERLEALHDIDMVINSSLDLRVTLNIFLDQVVEKLLVDAAVVLLLNPKTNMLEYSASRGFRTHTIEQYTLPMDEGLSGKAAMEHHLVKALNLFEVDDDLTYTTLMQEENFVSYYSVPLVAKGHVKGVLDIFNRTPLNPDQDWFNFLETLGGQAAIAIDNATLLEDLHRSNIELTLAYDTTLEGWSKALDLRDKETEGHTQRVVDITIKIARALGVPEEELIHIQRGALLHDIGKMGIPDSILLKPGPLTKDEWMIMSRHPQYAYDLIYPIAHLRPAVDIPYHHHERWDGGGYPLKLKGEEIPLAGRIFAIVDVWDAVTSDRPYRKAWTAKKALNYIRDQNGKHFDPRIVEIFLELVKTELIDHRD
ncbi:MAG: GAF domain-containing protein [Pelolinea sp.]|nr:GAF domain-containing protein [Pelolinea sp.]